MVLLSKYSRLLVRFRFNKVDPLLMPIPKDFPVIYPNFEIKEKNTGVLLLEEKKINAEFLLDILTGADFFLNKGVCEIHKKPHPHSAVVFQFSKDSKKIRKEKFIRRTLTNLLGEAVWGVRIYENPNSATFPLTINFGFRQPFFSADGRPLNPEEDGVLQGRDGQIFIEKQIQQNSAA